jgi:hypothetical protein
MINQVFAWRLDGFQGGVDVVTAARELVRQRVRLVRAMSDDRCSLQVWPACPECCACALALPHQLSHFG